MFCEICQKNHTIELFGPDEEGYTKTQTIIPDKEDQRKHLELLDCTCDLIGKKLPIPIYICEKHMRLSCLEAKSTPIVDLLPR